MTDRCPLSYEELRPGERYSSHGLKRLSPQLTSLHDLPWSAAEQRREAGRRAVKLSIQGIQPKLSARLSLKKAGFELVDRNGKFILKPQTELFPELPENEDLSMHLAASFGIKTPKHGLVWSVDGSLTYWIARFDRFGHRGKIATEDFAQLSGQNREQKYQSSMEKLAKVIDEFCTFPLLEKLKLFQLALFNFLIGNEDAHLKNFSLIRQEGKVTLSPAYDLLNTTIALKNPQEELALSLRGKKNKLRREDWGAYYGQDCLGLREDQVRSILRESEQATRLWPDWIQRSFLSEPMREKYRRVWESRAARIF